MPAQQGLESDQERGEPAESAEEQTVAGSEVGADHLAFEDAELVAEYENLDLGCSFGLPGRGSAGRA